MEYMKTKMAHGAIGIYFLTLVAAVISLFCSSCEASVPAVSGSKSERPFFEKVDFNAAIPSPQTVIGHRIGEKAVRYDMLVRYLEVLAQSSQRVRLASYGESHKGRRLYYLTITSTDNHKRLAEIKTDNSKLSDPRTLSGPEEAERILETMPAVAWLGYSIHGDELSSTDAAVYVAYHLAAGTDKATQSLVDKVVIHIAPLINPDGRERYLSQLEKKELPEGTIVAKSRQPHRRMLHTLLAFDPHFTEDFLADERKELENRRATRIYDVSSWNLAMAFGLEAYWAKRVPKVDSSSDTSKLLRRSSKLKDRSDYGYVIDFASSGIYPVLVRLFENECNPRVATKPFQIEGKSYKQGTILLRAHENPKSLFAVLEKICEELDIKVHPVDTGLSEDGPDLGAPKFKLLVAPRVAIASQWPISSTSFGSAWYLLDHELRLRSSAINIQGIGQIDLRKYNVLILPSSNGLDRIIDDKALKKVKRWIEEGGTLIAFGNSAVLLAGKERGLSSVRLRRNVLKDLSIYQEAVQRERAARDIKINTGEIWGTKTPEKKAENAQVPKEDGEKEKAQKDKDAKEDKDVKEDKDAKEDIEKLKRTDEWQRIFSPGGVFLAGHVNTEHWLGFGLEERLPIMLMGSYAFMSKHPVSTVVRLEDKCCLRLSGLLWPEARERLSNTAYATVESLGNGQVVLFATDPTFRTWLPGIQRLFFNAVLLGPGMGTSQPVPW